MVEQLQGPFEKFVDSPYSKKRLLLHLHKVLTQTFQMALVAYMFQLRLTLFSVCIIPPFLLTETF